MSQIQKNKKHNKNLHDIKEPHPNNLKVKMSLYYNKIFKREKLY